LEKFLTLQSRTLHFTYTVEDYCDPPGDIDPIYVANGQTTAALGPYASLEDMIAALRKASPGLEITIDKRQRRVVHIIDRRLEGVPGYFMAQRIKSFSYHGRLVPSNTLNLASAVGTALGAHIICGNCATTTFFGFEGWDAVVTLNAADTDARSILTDATYRMKHRLGQMWSCMTTHDEAGKLVSYVVFM
jgi:hypothetical protein